MKVPEQYGGLGLSQVYYNRALAEVAEEKLLAEARQLPLGLARRLDDLSCLSLSDGDSHGHQRSFDV